MPTALETELIKVGVHPPDDAASERLWNLVESAWAVFPDKDDKEQSNQRREFVTNRLRGEKAYALLIQWQPKSSAIVQMVNWALKRVGDDLPKAKVQRKRRAWVSRDEGQLTSSTTETIAPPSDDPSVTQPEETASPPDNHMRDLLKGKVYNFYGSNPLTEVKIRGRPLGDCTFDEARVGAEFHVKQASTMHRNYTVVLEALNRMRGQIPGRHVIRRYYTNVAEVIKIFDQAYEECQEQV